MNGKADLCQIASQVGDKLRWDADAVATGNYTWRGRQPGGTWGRNQEPQFLPGQKTVGHLLQEAGYRTGLFGKLHFGGTFENDAAGKPDFTRPMKVGPRQWGFTYSYLLLSGHQAPPYCFFENNRVDGDGAKVTQLEAGPRNGGVVPTAGPGLPDWDSRQVGPKLIEKALAFIDADKSQPFYIHLSTEGAHGPYTPPDDIVPTFVELAGGQFSADQMLDSVSLAPVLLGQRGDDQPVRQTLLIQSSPGRDAFTEGIDKDGRSRAEKPKPKAKAKASGKKMTAAEARQARNKAFNALAKKGEQSGSDGMAHALREGPWKLVFDIEHDAPAALYHLADDLTEQKNLIGEPAQKDRIAHLEKLYREIRGSKPSTPVPGE